MLERTFGHQHDWTRVTRREQCPICQHEKGCMTCACGRVACLHDTTGMPVPNGGMLGAYLHWLPGRGPQQRQDAGPVAWTPEERADRPTESVRPSKADAVTLDRVYRRLRELCPPSARHRAELGSPKRGSGVLAVASYGTIPPRRQQATIMGALVGEFTREVLLTVPGFIEDQSVAGGIRLAVEGMLIPYCDAEERIQAFQVRCDDNVYRWLSSTGQGGPGSGTPAHLTSLRGTPDDTSLYIVEGTLKAEIVGATKGARCIGIAGHSNWRTAVDLAAAVGERYGIVVIALDADDPAKPGTVAQVEASRQALAAELVQMGYAVRFARWDHAAGKGPDDLLLAGGDWDLERYYPMLGGQAQGAGAEDDDHAAGLDPGLLTDSRKLRILSNVLLNKSMKPVDKVTLCDIYLLTGAWPGVTPPPAPGDNGADGDGAVPPREPGRRKPIATIAARVNAGRSTVSRSIGHLEDQDLTDVERLREMPPPLAFPDAETRAASVPKTVAYFRPARALGIDEELPEALHRVVDRKRRCPSCGSERVITHSVTCTRCGAISSVSEAEQAAARYERERYAAAQDDGRTDSAHLTVNEEGCVSATRPDDGRTDSDDGALPAFPPVSATAAPLAAAFWSAETLEALRAAADQHAEHIQQLDVGDREALRDAYRVCQRYIEAAPNAWAVSA